MSLTKIGSKEFVDMFRVASHKLSENAKFVNSLNVFPVPDGDTGTNMSLTMQSGYKAINEDSSTNVGELAKSFAKGLLMGARGNSGVITSQLFRGFSQSLEGKETINANDLATAFADGVDTAYKAVMKPVEGTILSVAKGGSEAGTEAIKNTDDTIEVMRAIVKGAKIALEKTPSQLEVLKEVGVVDSGGQGLVFIYEGMLEGLTGEVSGDAYQPDEEEMDEMINSTHHQSVQGQFQTEEILNGYCTEMMITLGAKEGDQRFEYEEFRNYLNDLGDSLLVVADDEVAKVHVHTQTPEKIFSYGNKFGSLTKIKIDNMRIQHETIVEDDIQEEPKIENKKEEKRDYGIVAVSSGKVLSEVFKSLNVTVVINGGQTMNPSTNDIVDAINETNAERVIVLPNNGNIIMAANQAAEIADVPVAVVPSKTISQGITSLLSFDANADLETNKQNMTDALSTVKSGQITNAIRDTEINGVTIKSGQYMGIVDGEILVADDDLEDTAMEMLDKMIDEDSEIVSIFIGEDGAQEQAESIASKTEDKWEDVETEIHQGDQAIYPYLISVE